MPYEHSPEDRLKRYKASLEKMAKSEGKNLKTTSQVKKNSESTTKKQVTQRTSLDKTVRRVGKPKPPQITESPSKKELRESIATVRKSKKTMSDAKIKEIDGRNLIMLKVRQRSIESALKEIKKRRETLEAQLKSKFITKKQYQEEMAALVAEGRTLLVDKERVEKEMARLRDS
ncbi:MAG: hypothetical protein ACXABE_17200 [Candidatus Thorarchaeota archaeon]